MRQVPCYLIVGNGRLARHFIHYLSLMDLSHQHWHRKLPYTQLQRQLKSATHVLVLISDNAIESFIEQHLSQTSAMIIHCSGSLDTKLAYGAHPLMTFSHQPYELEQYKEIPFIVDETAPEANVLLPGFTNPVARLSAIKKARYHALCVLSGNFSCLLWQKLLSEFSDTFRWSHDYAFPYMQQQINNIMHAPESALTGPLVRGDQLTINKNMAALKGDPYEGVYQAFVEAYKKIEELAR